MLKTESPHTGEEAPNVPLPVRLGPSLQLWPDTEQASRRHRDVWLRRKSMNRLLILSLLLTLHHPPLTSINQIQFSSPPPLHRSVLRQGTPATYRTESIPLHTGWVPRWPGGLMKTPSNSPPFSLHPITYRKGLCLALLLLPLLFVFTALPPSVALLLRCGWLLWSGPAL